MKDSYTERNHTLTVSAKIHRKEGHKKPNTSRELDSSMIDVVERLLVAEGSDFQIDLKVDAGVVSLKASKCYLPLTFLTT